MMNIKINRETGLGRFLVAGLVLMALCAPAAQPQPAQALEQIRLAEGALARVVDGDTLEADLNGDGTLSPPGERVRLLFVDTPELGQSPKGQDLAHGLPARDFLAQAVQQKPLLLGFEGPRADRYGRTLALLWAGGQPVNLALIQQGHSYFDTRFWWPDQPEPYEAAEAAAFEAGRGIWSDKASRRRYLKRLKQEGKTPLSKANPLYGGPLAGEPFAVNGLNLPALEGKYLRVRGRLLEKRPAAHGVWLLALAAEGGGGPPGGLKLVAFSRPAQLNQVAGWRLGQTYEARGFLARWKGQYELQLHRGFGPAAPSN